ncbi:MAG: acetylglutamate kinase [Bacteroidales bacterium]|nr:acetylglutamate kinase [Bacteroidales bacterium]MBP5214372.1 acetylglutamate kinase [Bacteroidales bacterium]MBP5764549.1 acetylglutamate kinase [Bacteroidales bacterium]
MAQLTIVKVGGGIVEDEKSLHALLDKFARIEGLKVLVHGGGRSATRIAEQLNIRQTMIGGRRITDAETLKVVTMVYAGLVNKNIVAQLQKRHINALGLTGADMNVIVSHKRPVKKVKMEDGSVQDVDYGFVGDIDKVNAELIAELIAKGVVPVLSPIGHDKHGNLLNTNADTIAAETAIALANVQEVSPLTMHLSPKFEVRLMYCFEKKGVLRNPDDDDSVIPAITSGDFPKLVDEGIVSGGMLPKLENSFQAIRAGVREVIITQADAIDNPDAGTRLSQ